MTSEVVGEWGRKILIAVAVTAVVLVAAVQFAGLRCRNGTFLYTVPIERPVGQEDWRRDVAVLVDGDERLLTDDGLVMDAALSFDGERVVITKGSGSLSDEYEGISSEGLFLIDVDGSGRRRLTEPGPNSPDWSPDGETIAFLEGRTIGTVDVDDGDIRTIYELPPPVPPDPSYLIDLAWSGDSRRIAFFVGDGGSLGATLWTMRPDGSDVERVLDGDTVYGQLEWAPDRDAFAWSGSFRGVRSVMLKEGPGKPRQVEPHSLDPEWSRDGRQLAYVIGWEGHYDPRIVVGDATGEGEESVPLPDDARGGQSLIGWASC